MPDHKITLEVDREGTVWERDARMPCHERAIAGRPEAVGSRLGISDRAPYPAAVSALLSPYAMLNGWTAAIGPRADVNAIGPARPLCAISGLLEFPDVPRAMPGVELQRLRFANFSPGRAGG